MCYYDYSPNHRKRILRVLSTLSPIEELFYRIRFGFDSGETKTLEEVGEIFNLNLEQVRQIQSNVLRKFRNPPRSKIMRSNGPF